MKKVWLFLILISARSCWAGPSNESRREAEYYVIAYAQHYNVPVEFVRAIVEQVGMAPVPSFAKRRGGIDAAYA